MPPMPASPNRPTFEEFCSKYPICQQDSKWRLMVIDGSPPFRVFGFTDYADLIRARQIAWEDYEGFLALVADVKKGLASQPRD